MSYLNTNLYSGGNKVGKQQNIEAFPKWYWTCLYSLYHPPPKCQTSMSPACTSDRAASLSSAASALSAQKVCIELGKSVREWERDCWGCDGPWWVADHGSIPHKDSGDPWPICCWMCSTQIGSNDVKRLTRWSIGAKIRTPHLIWRRRWPIHRAARAHALELWNARGKTKRSQ